MEVGFTAKSLALAISRFRASGNLNFNNKGLTEVPKAVYDYNETLDPSVQAKWFEYSDPVKIDLSHNELQELPAKLADLIPLTYIDVSCNKLAQLPEAMTQLTHLKLLDLSRNVFPALPDFLAALPALVSFSCPENKLGRLPEDLGARQPALAVVNASNNLIASLPAGLKEARALIKLELQNNKIASIPEDYFNRLSLLSELNLSKNNISGQLPSCFSSLVSLKIFYFRENHIDQIPDSISCCTNLVELYAGFNKLESIPESLSVLTSLRTLEFRNNRLSQVPASLSSLPLHMLDLSNNSLQTLPVEVGLMTTLRSMPLGGNPMKGIRTSLTAGPLSTLLKALRSRLPDPKAPPPVAASGARRTRSGSKGSEVRSGNVFGADEAALAAQAAQQLLLSNKEGEIVLKGSKIKEIPEQVWEAAGSCLRLDLSGLSLTSWSAERLASFSRLRTLRMTGMGLKEWPLPAGEVYFSGLEHLSLDKNPIKDVPQDGFAAFPNVRELYVAGVPGMSSLPQGALLSLSQLTILDLSQTRLSTLPRDLLSLSTLRTLRLRDNSLTSLPEEVTRLSRLEELDLANNSLSNVPPRVGLMGPTLKSLMLEGNILKTIRRTVLDRGTPAVLEYLRDRIPT